MRIGDKFALVIFSIYGIYASVDSLIQYKVLLPAFERQEQKHASERMDLVLNNIERDLQRLSELGESWQLDGIDASSVPTQRLGSAGVDFLAVVDGRFRVLSRTPSLPEPLPTGALEEPGSKAGRGLTTFLASWRAAAMQARTRGLLLTTNGPALIVLQPLDAAAGAAPKGQSLVIGRFLTDEVLADIGQRSQVVLGMELPGKRDAPARDTAFAIGETKITPGAKDLRVSRMLADPLGRPVVRLAFPASREITVQARSALRFAMFSLVLAGSLVVLTMMVVINRLVVLPVRKIEAFVEAIAGSDDLSPRLAIQSKDEFGRLAGRINVMVDRLEQARREIVDRSFEAGLAEMARGVLHNIGNALTPAMVRAGGLQRQLRDLPLAEMEKASTELQRQDLDPARRADLERFQQLVGSAVAARADTLLTEASALDEGLQAIQAMLQDQTRFASTSHLVERVALVDLVNQSLRLVPPDRLAKMTVVRDASLEEVGSLSLPRTALTQVIQNLVLNACEAVRPGQQGVMHIRSTLIQEAGHRCLAMDFQDDGIGIPPDVLPRLFSKGFSTKSPTTNCGLGLHWCANVLQAMDGSLRAFSDGPGKGATFHLELPLA